MGCNVPQTVPQTSPKCTGGEEFVEDGDVLEIDLERARIANARTGKTLQGQPLAEEMLTIIKKGGVAALLCEEYGKGG